MESFKNIKVPRTPCPSVNFTAWSTPYACKKYHLWSTPDKRLIFVIWSTPYKICFLSAWSTQASSKKGPLASGKIVPVTKMPDNNIEKYTIGYFTENTLNKKDALPKMEQLVIFNKLVRPESQMASLNSNQIIIIFFIII